MADSSPVPDPSIGGPVGLPIHRGRELPPAGDGELREASSANPQTSAELVTQVPVPSEQERTVFMPPIDIYDTGDGLVLLADLPGVTIETLEIQVQDNRLTLYGRVNPVVAPDARLLHQEFEWGDFLRSFILSDEVNHDRITAKLNNGVLEVVLPRMPKAEPRRIQVNRE